jgi:hypothetical protein
MILQPNPWPPLVLPDPEILIKYGKLAASAMRALRKKARAKGREHQDWLNQNGLNIFR